MDSNVVIVVKELEKIFGFGLKKEPNVVIVQSRKEIDEIKGYKTEGWVVAFVQEGKIYILDKDKMETEAKQHTKNDFDKILKHEITHLFFAQLVGDFKPRWLNEGVACYFAGQEKIRPKEENIYRLQDYFEHGDRFMYNLGYFWTKYLIEENSLDSFMRFLKEWGENEKTVDSFEELFKKSFGFGLDVDSLKRVLSD